MIWFVTMVMAHLAVHIEIAEMRVYLRFIANTKRKIESISNGLPNGDRT